MQRFEREAKAALDRVQAFAEGRSPHDVEDEGPNEEGLANSMRTDERCVPLYS